MGFKSIGKRFAKSGMQSAEGVEYFMQSWPTKITKSAKSDFYLQEYNYLRPKLKDVKKKRKKEETKE